MAKKIVIINGSPRKNGNTAKILHLIKNRLESNRNLDIVYIDLSDYPLNTCSGCGKCYQNGFCTVADKAEKINHDILNANGIIIGSPTYVNNVPGMLKNYLDRGHFVLEQAFNNKYSFVISTYEISGGGNVIKILENMLCYSGAILTENISYKLKQNKVLLNDKVLLNKLYRKTDRFYDAIKNGVRKNVINKFIHMIAFHFIIKPGVFRNKEYYNAVILKWKMKNII